LTLGLQYVLTQALFQPQAEFFPGIFGPEFEPTWLNTLRALGLRMVVVVPLIVLGGRWFYPALWKDLSNLNRGPIRESRLVLAISGGLLFLSQWLLYRSVGQTAAGIGVTLFFVYPAVLAILAWLLMGDRPPLFRTYSMITLGVGAMFILLLAETGVNGEGIFIGLLSGTTFALYLLITSRCSQQLHPLVVTIIQFMIVLGLTLPAWLLPSQIPEQQFTPFLLGGLLLGAAATLSYLFNTFSVRLTGATPTAVTSDLTPLLTILLSLWVLQMGIGAYQSVGVLLVTLGALALGLERLQRVRRLRRS
jgi:drug/metabolite transporter (DMT)-like permease